MSIGGQSDFVPLNRKNTAIWGLPEYLPTMTTEAQAPASAHGAATRTLSDQWRALTRFATLVAVLTSPAAFIWFFEFQELRLRYALLLTLVEMAAFRGLVDLVFRR